MDERRKDRKWKKYFKEYFGYGDMGWGARATRDRGKVEKEDSLVFVKFCVCGELVEGLKQNFDCT